MRYLIICDNFSGPLIPIARWLNGRPDSETLLASDRVRYPVGLKKIILKISPAKAAQEDSLDCAASIIQKAKYAKKIFQSVRESGFYPDKIFIFSVSGISLAGIEVFEDAQKIIFLERDRIYNKAKARALGALRDQLLLDSDFAFCFSPALMTNLPKPLSSCVSLAPLCVDPAFYPKNAEKRLTVFYLKNLDPEALAPWLESAREYARRGRAAIFLPTKQEAKAMQEELKPLQAWAGCDPSLDTARAIFSQCGLFIAPDGELSYDMLAAMSCGARAASAASHELLSPGKDYILLEKGALPHIPEGAPGIGAAARKSVKEGFSAEKVIPEILKDVFRGG